MTQKRKAAAHLFREQNIVNQSSTPRLRTANLDEDDFEEVMVKSSAALPPGAPLPAPAFDADALKTSEELQLEKEPIAVRETGFLLWRWIIVPPNVYVVHTRAGRKEPVTIGLGKSFRYNTYTDAYLVVPAAMQTIGVVANCISQEKQGINILAYVQWQIDDFSVAYRKLDFSDSRDPLGIVNAQLREQAEAAVKDKISTMSVEEVLTDKAPVIAELTTRLRAVAEGRGQNDSEGAEGLGIKIVTVQIREALVSSQRLWTDLQAPFRHDKDRAARISHLESQDAIRLKELQTKQASETREAETMVEIERIKQGKETEAVELRLSEEETRFIKEQETLRTKTQLEEATTLAAQESEQRIAAQAEKIEQEQRLQQIRLENETKTQQKELETEQALQSLREEVRLEISKAKVMRERLKRETTLKTQVADFKQLLQEQADVLEAQTLAAKLERDREQTLANLANEEEINRVKLALREKESEIDRLHQEIRNLTNAQDLSARLIETLPEIAAQMPAIEELRILQTGNGDASVDALAAFVTRMMAIVDSLGISIRSETPPQIPDDTSNGQ
ncbi:MAG: SPFH domain-containing protein [Chloroflexota bacterium]